MNKYPRLTDSEREALDDNYSVMPSVVSDEAIDRRENEPEKGMTKRERFAVLLLQAIIDRCPQDVWRGTSPEGMAKEAVDHADALLSALESKP